MEEFIGADQIVWRVGGDGVQLGGDVEVDSSP